MKKSILLLAVAAVAMASCSKDQTTSINSIGSINFRTSMGKPQAKANQTTLTNLGAFKVTAIGNGATYFTDLAVTSSDNGTSWVTEATHYWPAYELGFFAYAPADITGVSINNTAQKINDFTTPAAIADQKDVVISYNSGSKTANGISGVAMNFKHALSQIQVKAKCMNANMKIEVIGVKVAYAGSKSSFTFPAVQTSSAYALVQSQWTVPTAKASYMSKGIAPVILTTDAQSIMFGDNNFMLIPQQLTSWTTTDKTNTSQGAYLSVLCRISSIDNGVTTLLFPTTATKYGYSSVPVNTNWEPGKKYIYTLEFCGTTSGGGVVDPNPLPTGADIETPGTGGDKILGAPIKFTVTVDGWADASGGDVQM